GDEVGRVVEEVLLEELREASEATFEPLPGPALHPFQKGRRIVFRHHRNSSHTHLPRACRHPPATFGDPQPTDHAHDASARTRQAQGAFWSYQSGRRCISGETAYPIDVSSSWRPGPSCRRVSRLPP